MRRREKIAIDRFNWVIKKWSGDQSRPQFAHQANYIVKVANKFSVQWRMSITFICCIARELSMNNDDANNALPQQVISLLRYYAIIAVSDGMETMSRVSPKYSWPEYMQIMHEQFIISRYNITNNRQQQQHNLLTRYELWDAWTNIEHSPLIFCRTFFSPRDSFLVSARHRAHQKWETRGGAVPGIAQRHHNIENGWDVVVRRMR